MAIIREKIRCFMVRALLVLAIIVTIAFFLYTPRIMRFFSTQKSITILAWPQEIDATACAAFERETGIKVIIRYFENNEELMIKLASGDHGIDVVMPTDYAAQELIKRGLLKKLDKSRLSFMHTLDARLLGHYFDANNDYTIPYYWGVYGLGFDKDYFGDTLPISSWRMIFDRRFKSAHIAVPDNARYLVLIAARYLFGTIDNLDNERMERINNYLIAQKPTVELYTESRGEYLLASKESRLVVLLSADVAKVMKHVPRIGFTIPDEGSFMLIDSFALSAYTDKEDLVYTFLNYLYRPEVLQVYVDKFMFFPATTNVKVSFQPKELELSPELYKKLDFYRNVIPKSVLNDIWIGLKS